MAFALAMGGAARKASGDRVRCGPVSGFLNTIARSKAMTAVLQSSAVREWVAKSAEGKELGHIVVPVVIPPGEDAERFLARSDKHEGWNELGDILQALRAHDKRIEDALPEMLTIQLPPEGPPELELETAVAVGRPDRDRLEYAVVTGSRDQAEDTARAAVKEGR